MRGCHGEGAVEKGCGPGWVTSRRFTLEANASQVFSQAVGLWDYENVTVRQTFTGTQGFSNAYEGKGAGRGGELRL